MNTDYSILEKGNKIYFASDFHLDVPQSSISLEREKKIIRWLDSIKNTATAIFLVGDIFDFWFEYGQVIPKGFARFQGKIAELTDSGINVIFFTGNHDLWMSDYFPLELGVKLFTRPEQFLINGKKFLIGHGDGLGSGNIKYKFYKKIFTNPLCKWMFRWLHPNIGVWLASGWLKYSRLQCETKPFLNKEETLVNYSESIEKKEHHDYYIFGHRHLPINYQINKNSRYINLGQWFNQCNYGVFDGEHFELIVFENNEKIQITTIKSQNLSFG